MWRVIAFVLPVLLSCASKSDSVPRDLRSELVGFSDLVREVSTPSYVTRFVSSYSDPLEGALSMMASGIWTKYSEAVRNLHLIPEEKRVLFAVELERAYKDFDRKAVMRLLEEYRSIKERGRINEEGSVLESLRSG